MGEVVVVEVVVAAASYQFEEEAREQLIFVSSTITSDYMN